MADEVERRPRPARWWLPENPEERVSGLYWIDDDGAARITVHERLAAGPRLFRADSIPLLHGNVLGRAVTIVNARPVDSTIPMRGDVHRMEYSAMLAYEGLMLTEGELAFDKARFGIGSLDEWADWESWVDLDDDHPGKPPRLEHRGKQRRSIACRGGILSLQDGAGWSQSDGAWTLTSGCRFDLRLETAISLDDLDYRWLRPLQLLITTATSRRSPLLHLSVSSTAWEFEGSDGGGRPPGDWVRVRYRSRSAQSSTRLSSLYYRHRLADFDAERQIPAFFDAAEHHRYALERYSDASSEVAVGRETIFLNAIQAVEALDTGLHQDVPSSWQEELAAVVEAATVAAGYSSRRRRAARRGAEQAHLPSLAGRLRRMDAETGHFVSDLAGRDWPEDVEILRNAITHGRTGEVLRRTTDALVVATQISKFLWDVRWLVVLGFDVEDAQRLVKRRVNQWSDAGLIKDHHHLLHETAEALRALRVADGTSGTSAHRSPDLLPDTCRNSGPDVRLERRPLMPHCGNEMSVR